jgi:hypothetical protein
VERAGRGGRDALLTCRPEWRREKPWRHDPPLGRSAEGADQGDSRFEADELPADMMHVDVVQQRPNLVRRDLRGPRNVPDGEDLRVSRIGDAHG